VPRAKIFPCFRLETQIRRTTVDGGRASLASPVMRDQNYWKLELAPFRCSVPHSPSWWRVSQVRLRGCCAAAYVPDACFPARTCGGTAVSSVSQAVEACSTLTVTGRTCTATGPRFTRNLLTIPRHPRRGQATLREFPHRAWVFYAVLAFGDEFSVLSNDRGRGSNCVRRGCGALPVPSRLLPNRSPCPKCRRFPDSRAPERPGTGASAEHRGHFAGRQDRCVDC
jgi:hypothetical protein